MAGPLTGVGAGLVSTQQLGQSQSSQTQQTNQTESEGIVSENQTQQQVDAQDSVVRNGNQVNQTFEANNSDLIAAETDFSFDAAQLAGNSPPRGSLVDVLT